VSSEEPEATVAALYGFGETTHADCHERPDSVVGSLFCGERVLLLLFVGAAVPREAATFAEEESTSSRTRLRPPAWQYTARRPAPTPLSPSPAPPPLSCAPR